MTQAFAVETTINESAERVWAAIVDWPNAHLWMPGIESLSADGPLAAGTELTFHARGKDRPSVIAELDEGTSVTLRSIQGGVTADYRYQVEPIDDAATRVKLAADCSTSGAWNLAGPILRRVMRRTDAGQLEALKATIEAT